MTERWVCFNGAICPEKEVCVSALDRGFLFGEGIFTTLRVDHGKVELFDLHITRLKQQARVLGFDFFPPPTGWLDALMTQNHAYHGTWRLKVILTKRILDETAHQGIFLALMEPYTPPQDLECRLCLYPQPFERPAACLKSLSYLDNLLVKDYAKNRGFDDAITVSASGYLLETGCSNLFWVEGEVLHFPDPSLHFLKGVFAQALMTKLSIPVKFVKASWDDLPFSAQVYVCNSLTHVRPVASIGKRIFARSARLEERLQDATLAAIDQDSYNYISRNHISV